MLCEEDENPVSHKGRWGSVVLGWLVFRYVFPMVTFSKVITRLGFGPICTRCYNLGNRGLKTEGGINMSAPKGTHLMRMGKRVYRILACFLALLVLGFGIACNGSNGGDGGDGDNGHVTYRIYGLNFSPYLDGQDPNQGSSVSEEQIRNRMEIIAPYTKWIRTFGCSLGLENAGRIARELGLKAAIGAWLDDDLASNEEEMQNLVTAAKDGYVDLAIVGSEVLLRGDITEDQLIEYINYFRNEVSWVPVTTAEVYTELLTHPNVMDACDVICVNYYPYWEGKGVHQAIAYLHALHQEVLAKANGKEVVVSETGWPSDGNPVGDAIPSIENACLYFLNFVSWARAEGVNYFYFEAFDEEWKAAYEGPQGAHWGVWYKDGTLKPCMQGVFDDMTMADNWSCQDIPGGSGPPVIEFTYVPPYGSFDDLEGQVWHVQPDQYRVTVYIKVGSGWWTKPYWDNPLTFITCDGSWICDITTGGFDNEAIEIVAFLVGAGYDPPLAGGEPELPADLYQNAADIAQISRSP